LIIPLLYFIIKTNGDLMPERKSRLPIVILIVLLIIGAAIYVIARIKTKTTEQPEKVAETTQTSTEDLTNIDPTTLDSQIKENLNLATSKALAWRSDAVLVYVQYKITSLTPGEGMETYVFDSPSAKDVHYTVTISQKSKNFIRAVIPTEDYLGPGLLPIDFKYWKLNYASALQLAEKEGGKDFREKNLNWTIELNLKRGEPKNWLWWIVEYKTEEGESLSVQINPYSGEVLTGTETGT
jgi:hypothetical protein